MSFGVKQILRTCGVISRVDMSRRDPLLFRGSLALSASRRRFASSLFSSACLQEAALRLALTAAVSSAVCKLINALIASWTSIPRLPSLLLLEMNRSLRSSSSSSELRRRYKHLLTEPYM